MAPPTEASAHPNLRRDGHVAVPFCYCNSRPDGALYNPSAWGDLFIGFGSGFVIGREPKEECVKKVSSFIAILFIAVLVAGCQPAPPRSSPPDGSSFFPTSVATVSIRPLPTATPSAPDAQTWIAFLRDDNLWIIHPDGSELRQVTAYPASGQASGRHIGVLRWSPDGTLLAFTYGRRGLYVVNVYDVAASTTRVLLGETGGAFDWSPSGTELIYNSPLYISAIPVKSRGLWTYEPARKRKRLVLPIPDDQNALIDLHWSADGRHVLGTPAAGDLSSRTIVDLTRGSKVDLAAYLPPVRMCAWAPAEATLACVTAASPDDPRFDTAIAFVDVNGNVLNEVALPPGWKAASANWSPDGTQVAVGYQDADSKPGTALLHIGTEQAVPLTASVAAGWSPDGAWLLASDAQPGQEGPADFSIVSISSGQAFALLPAIDPLWQPAPRPAEPQVNAVPTEALAATLFTTPMPDVMLSIKYTPKGGMLMVHTRTQDYELGPLAKGSFAIGPNRKFFVYCTNNGIVYAARFGQPTLTTIGNIRDFIILRKGGEIRPAFLFFGDNPYTVKVTDMVTGQEQILSLPRNLTADK